MSRSGSIWRLGMASVENANILARGTRRRLPIIVGGPVKASAWTLDAFVGAHLLNQLRLLLCGSASDDWWIGSYAEAETPAGVPCASSRTRWPAIRIAKNCQRRYPETSLWHSVT